MILANYQINLTKIQSLPLVGRDWEYFFHLDMEFSNYSDFLESIETIKPLIQELTILGEYKKGQL
jgi:prephenate dehydratase